MKVVFVTPAVPHPFGDTAARSYYVLAKELLARGHEVRFLTVTEEDRTRVDDATARLAAVGGERFRLRAFEARSSVHPLRRKLRSALRPFSETYFADGLRDAVRTAAREGYDVLHLEQLWSGWLAAEFPRSLLNVHHFEIIDWEGRTGLTPAERKALWQMGRATTRILAGTENLRVFTSRLEAKALEINAALRCWTVPFALDLSLYPVQPTLDAPVAGVIGSMHWVPSRSAGERLITRIWPLVRARLPDARLLVAGWNARKYLERFLPAPGVTLEDSVPHPTDFFRRVSTLVYAPSRGSGMKIKVLESMAYGIPVVTTAEGAEGLDARSGVHCWIEEDDVALAERTCELLTDRARRDAMAGAARALVEERCSAIPTTDRMAYVYDRVVSS